LLTHLPERETLVRRLSGSLAPGGWLLLEEFDDITASVPDPRLSPEQATVYQRVQRALHAHTATRRAEAGITAGLSAAGCWMPASPRSVARGAFS
jgi:hypothetical protein